ncbi:helix-turn-helix transcriptional regulator [Microbacterium yannicii]|nr:AraC family transcriptional regulator [Microbacterium yannicii]MCO5954554.1 AraC family transcriptional regulator [Microbacterium yannicii]
MPIDSVDRSSDSPYVARVWRGRTSGVETMTSVATSTWELVFWDDAGAVHAAVRGPETAASTVQITADSASFGITLSHGTSMPHLPVADLVDGQRESRHVTERTFLLGGKDWEIPDLDDAELLVQKLVRAGVLVRDPLVDDVVWGGVARVGSRSVQRRVAAATGLTQGAIRQIERAREAAVLLSAGALPLDVVHQLGYYDQPHLARSLQRFIGRTATQLRQPDGASTPLSLLYKPDDPGAS